MSYLRLVALILLAVGSAAAGRAEGGLFLPAELLPLDPKPSMVVIGDVTGDRRDDVVLGTSGCSDPGSCRFFVLPQTPFGTLTGPFAYPIWPPQGLAVGDFNGDGRGDVAVENGGELSIYHQDAVGTLLPPVNVQPTYGILELAVGDLNGDGRTDIASIPSGGYNIDLFFQTARGGLGHQSIDLSEIGHQDLLVEDLDGDGLDDILLFAGGQAHLTFLYQKPSGGFTQEVARDFGSSATYDAAAVGNFDSDPLPEIVVASRDGSLVKPFRLQIVDQSIPRSWALGSLVAKNDFSSIAVADLDGDDRDDIVALDRALSVDVWRQRKAGTFELDGRYPILSSNYHETSGLALGDLDHDGLLDVAVASDNFGLLTLMQRNDTPGPPPGPWLSPSTVPGFELKVRITAGATSIAGALEPACIAETACVSGALPGRSEVFLRVIGPKPNGYLWPTLVKFSTSTVEVWLRQLTTGVLRYYRLEGARPGHDELPGLFDRTGFEPDLGSASTSLLFESLATTDDEPPEAPETVFTSEHFPDFRFRVRISAGGEAQQVRQEADCIEETLCLSGAVPGRSEAFLRIVGPKPNGRLWPMIVKLTTSTLEVWIEQISTGEVKYYRIEGAAPGRDDLTGLFDRSGFAP